MNITLGSLSYSLFSSNFIFFHCPPSQAVMNRVLRGVKCGCNPDYRGLSVRLGEDFKISRGFGDIIWPEILAKNPTIYSNEINTRTAGHLAKETHKYLSGSEMRIRRLGYKQ